MEEGKREGEIEGKKRERKDERGKRGEGGKEDERGKVEIKEPKRGTEG